MGYWSHYSVSHQPQTSLVCLLISLCTAVLYLIQGSPAIIPAGLQRRQFWTELLFKYSLSHLIMSRFLTERDTDSGEKEVEKCSCLFYRSSEIIGKAGDCGHMFASLGVYLRFQTRGHAAHCERSLLTKQPVGWSKRQRRKLWLCVFRGPREREWRRSREQRALTHYLKPHIRASDSHGGRMTQASRSHLHMDTQIHVHPYTNTFVLYLSHTHIQRHTYVCVCTLMQNKAGCLLFTGCGNRFASMCSLSHEGRGIQKEM